jgi:hypothetical protein
MPVSAHSEDKEQRGDAQGMIEPMAPIFFSVNMKPFCARSSSGVFAIGSASGAGAFPTRGTRQQRRATRRHGARTVEQVWHVDRDARVTCEAVREHLRVRQLRTRVSTRLSRRRHRVRTLKPNTSVRRMIAGAPLVGAPPGAGATYTVLNGPSACVVPVGVPVQL